MTETTKHNDLFSNISADFDASEAVTFGPYSSDTWKNDPKHLFFHMARYKFCSKMLAGSSSLLEVGCGEAFSAPILLQTVNCLHGIDIVDEIIEYNNQHCRHNGRASFACRNLAVEPLSKKFDAAICIDVIEHIPKENEECFITNIAASLLPYSPLIVGTPNVTSTLYASEASKCEHINLQSHESLKLLLSRHFHKVFIFSMNDEMVHTGFYPMAHYLLAMAIAPKKA